MSKLQLLEKRNNLYKPLNDKLIKNKFNFKKDILLYELELNKSDFFKLKKIVKQYLLKSLNIFHGLKINLKKFNIEKFSNLILKLPNITPNGVIVPKKENLAEYLRIQNFIFDMMKKYFVNTIAHKIELCDVRLMRSNKHNYNNNRSYSSTKIHSDSWSGNPCDAKIAFFIDGDKSNTIEFYRPNKIDNKFFDKKTNYESAIKKYGYKKIKTFDTSKLTIFDQACLHKTINKNKNLRLSLDFGIIIHKGRKSIFLKRYKKRFLSKKKITINQLIKSLSPKSIHEKFN